MKYLMVAFFLFLASHLPAQYIYTIKADSVKITSCDSAELIIENHTQGIPGFLFNTGNGRTQFRRALIQQDDSTYLIGVDTLHTLRLGYWAPHGTAIYNTNPGYVGINQPYPQTTLDVGGLINVPDTGYYNIGNQPVLKDFQSNLLVGIGSAYLTTFNDGGMNAIIGEYAGARSTIGQGNLLVGDHAGYAMQGVTNSTYVGYYSGGTTSGNLLGNSCLGSNSGAYSSGQYNTNLGFEAGSTTHGNYNVSAGWFAGGVATGDNNVYVGGISGQQAIGSLNSSLGYNSFINGQGTDNVSIGENAGSGIVGDDNVYLGSYAGNSNTGRANTCVGFWAGGFGGTGSNNVAIGNYALYNGTQVNCNVFVGDSILGINYGNYNSFLGARAGLSALYIQHPYQLNSVTLVGGKTDVAGTQSLSDATAIGYQAVVKASNTMVFGDSAVNSWLFNSRASAISNAALVVGNNSTNGNGAYLSIGGVWTNASDRNKKENFQPLNQSDLLAKIDELPVTRWNYVGAHEQHIGPVAQDFYRLFHVGSDDKTISTIDPSGIALAGVQGLHQKIRDQQAEIDSLRTKLEKQQDDMAKIMEKLNAFEAMLKAPANREPAYAKQP